MAIRKGAPGAKLFDILAPGLYAWGLTVGWPVSQRFAPLGSRIFALLAVVSLVAGASLVFLAPTLSRIFGIWVFVASCLGAWALVGQALSPMKLDSIQGILGAFGWALFAISWGGDAPTSTPTSTAPPTPAATATHLPLPKPALLLLTLVAVAAATPMLLAWSVQTTERALFAHVVSLAAAIALIAFAVELFEPRSAAERAGFSGLPSPERRISNALPALTWLALLGIAGAAYALLR